MTNDGSPTDIQALYYKHIALNLDSKISFVLTRYPPGANLYCLAFFLGSWSSYPNMYVGKTCNANPISTLSPWSSHHILTDLFK